MDTIKQIDNKKVIGSIVAVVVIVVAIFAYRTSHQLNGKYTANLFFTESHLTFKGNHYKYDDGQGKYKFSHHKLTLIEDKTNEETTMTVSDDKKTIDYDGLKFKKDAK